jgi:NitT/TauT family transport system substrate-binding protein
MRRAALIAGINAGLVVAHALPAQAQSASGRFPLTVILVATADVVPFLYAQSQGMFARAGLDLTSNVVSSGSIAVGAIAGGAAQIGYANPLSVIGGHVRGIPFAIIAPGGQHDPNAPNSELFVLKDGVIRSVRDLDGKVIAVVGLHDLQTLSARTMLDAAGVDSSHIKFVEMPQSTMLDALVSKRVDAVVSFEPFRTSVEGSGSARSLGAPFNAMSREMMYTGWVAMRPWVEANREVASRFAAVIRDAVSYTNAHTTEVLPLIADITKLPLETLTRSHRIRDAVAVTPNLVQPIIDAAAKFKEIPAVFPASDLLVAGI